MNDFEEPSESHVELAKLSGYPIILVAVSKPKISPLTNQFDHSEPSESVSAQSLGALLRALAASRNQQQQLQRKNELISDAPARTNDLISATNYQQELNKLLRCNYTGISDLYWCNTGN